MRVLSIFGTRPEAIKLAPLIRECESRENICSLICCTGQHREMIDPLIRLFELHVDEDLKLMKTAQDITYITSTVLNELAAVFDKLKPDLVVVQGDTTTAMSAALAAFYKQIPVAHVEAGLRTGEMYFPWPEEVNRKIISCLTTFHFAPTESARQNLLAEGVDDKHIIVTGNTVIDALFWVRDHVLNCQSHVAELSKRFEYLDANKRLLLVTGHRRENHDGGIGNVCSALKTLATRGDVEILYPVHPNPRVQSAVYATLSGVEGVHLIAPQDYLPFVWLMNKAYLIITDSGGVQEEAPSLGKPVLVTRSTTERPEAVEAGTVKLVGIDVSVITSEATRLLDDPDAYVLMAQAYNPYGDGLAAGRIVDHIENEM